MKRRGFIKNSVVISAGTYLIPFSDFDFKTDNKPLWKIAEFLDDDVVKIETDKDIIIYGFDITMNGKEAYLSLNKNLTFYCFHFKLNGSLKNKGKDLSIYTYQFEQTDGTSIDLSGNSYNEDKDQPIEAKSGLSFEKPDADDGDDKLTKDGGDSGNLLIACAKINILYNVNLSGGSGGNGQNGGNGFKGGPGKNGTNITVTTPKKNDQKVRSEANAGNGKQGGTAGTGGRAGNGGNGGKITLIRFGDYGDNIYITTSRNFNFVNNSGGNPGKPGSEGKPGSGGDPGSIGKIIWVHKDEIEDDGSGTAGESGSVGNKGKVGANGKWGLKGGASENSMDYSYFGNNYLNSHPIFCEILTDKIEATYIAKNYPETIEILNYLNKSLRLYKGNDNFLKSVQRKYAAYGKQIAAGIDYWGNNVLYAVTIAPKILTQNIDPIFRSAVTFETAYLELLNKVKQKQAIASECKTLVEEGGNQLRAKQKARDDAHDSLVKLNEEINYLSVQIIELQKAMIASEVKFRQAVQDSISCDNIFKIFSFLSKLISIGTGLYESVDSISQSGAKIVDTLDKKVGSDYNKNLVSKVKSISTAANDIDGKITDFKDQWNALGEHVDDNMLLSIQSRDLESLLTKYENLKEAKQLKIDMKNYTDTVDTRNNKRQQFTTDFCDYLKYDADIEDLKNRLSDKTINLIINENKLPSSDWIIRLKKMYQNLKFDMIQLLYLQQKSLEYASLKKFDKQIEPEQSISFQNQLYTSISKDIVFELSNKANGPQEDKSGEIKFTIENADVLLPSLVIDNKLSLYVKIPIDTEGFPSDHKEIYAHTLHVRVQGLSGKSTLRYSVTHLGNSVFARTPKKGGGTIEFSHEEAPVFFSLDTEKFIFENETYIHNNLLGKRIGNDQEYLGLSPFTTWHILFTDFKKSDWIFAKNVGISFEFIYFYCVG